MFDNISYSGLQPLSYQTASDNSINTVIEKYSRPYSCKAELRNKQAAVDQKRLLISATIADLKANIKNFRELSLKLTDDEKSLITNYIEELKDT